MKAVLNSLSFAIIAGYVAAETAELAGARLPSYVNASNAVVAFSMVAVLAILVADYGRKNRIAFAPSQTAVRPTITRVRRQAYSIRRGAEAARLAPPPARPVFRRVPCVHYERAA